MTDATPNPLYNLECAPNTGNHEDPDLLAGDNLDKLRGRNPYPAMSERYRLTEELENAKYQNNLLIKRCRELEKQRDEARIRVCELCARMGGVYRRVHRELGSVVECRTPEEIAEVFCWDCFKQGVARDTQTQ